MDLTQIDFSPLFTSLHAYSFYRYRQVEAYVAELQNKLHSKFQACAAAFG